MAASYWFRRTDKDHPTDQLRIQLEALYQFAQDPRFSTQGTLLAGLLGMSRNGFGGSFAVGPEYIDSYVGLRVMGGLQFSWGPHVRNPWAERKAAEPKETPAWIWTLLGAIDPILREDGCVWTDPTPRQASYKWFCIGKPDVQNPGSILLDNGGRLPIGTHLLEHGTALRINDGTKVAEIPLTARFRKAALDYLDGLMRHDPDPMICDGRIAPIPSGLDAGWASVVSNDDFGGSAAVVGMQLYREITCNPGTQSAADILGMIGKFGGRGPMRAKPDIANHVEPPSELSKQAIWTRGGSKSAVQNAYAHWQKHGTEFPELRNAVEYVDRARAFAQKPPTAALTRRRSNGDIVIYDPHSNTLVVCDANRAPRTMFKPDPAKHGYGSNLDYFNAQ